MTGAARLRSLALVLGAAGPALAAAHAPAGDARGLGPTAAVTDTACAGVPWLERLPRRERTRARYRLAGGSPQAFTARIEPPKGRTPFPHGLLEPEPPRPPAVRVAGGRLVIERGTRGNYHWLEVAGTAADGTRVRAATAHYFSGYGPAPTALLARPRPGLVLLPDPLPREHARYRAGEPWPFRVWLDGRPLAGAEVALCMAGRLLGRWRSDAEGRVRVRFPVDAPLQTAQGRHGRHRAAPFRLVVRATDTHGTHHAASFACTLHAPVAETRSGGAGLGALLAGAGLGTLALRRRGGRAGR